MKAIEAKDGTVKRFEMAEDEYAEYDESSTGLCLACGAERDCCEPDAENYKCEECGKRQVFGVPQLLIMGLVEITDDEDN